MLPFVEFLMRYDQLVRLSFTAHTALAADQVSRFAYFLQNSKTVKHVKLSPLTEGGEHIVDALKDNTESVLKEFVGEGEFDPGSDSRLPFESSKIDTCITINRIKPQLSETSMSEKEAFEVYEPYLQNTPVLYALLRYRPEIWCNTFLS